VNTCICRPTRSKSNNKCNYCFPEHRGQQTHDMETADERAQREARGQNTGTILRRYEPMPENHSDED